MSGKRVILALVAVCFCAGAWAAVETYKEEFTTVGLGDLVWVQGDGGWYTGGVSKGPQWVVEDGSLHYVKSVASPTVWATYPISNISEGFSWTNATPIQLLPVAYTIHITDLSGWLAAPGLRLTVGTQAFEEGGGALDYPLFEFTTSSVKVYSFSGLGGNAEVDLSSASTLDLTYSYEVGQITTKIVVDGGAPVETVFPEDSCHAADTIWFYFYIDNQGAWSDGASHGPQTADFKIDALSITTDPTLTTRAGGGEVTVFPEGVTFEPPVSEDVPVATALGLGVLCSALLGGGVAAGRRRK